MPATESQLEELQEQAAKKCQGLPICYNFQHPHANTPSWYRISDFKEAERWQQVATTVTTVAGVLAWCGMIVRCFKYGNNHFYRGHQWWLRTRHSSNIDAKQSD
eukprot:g67677.t1